MLGPNRKTFNILFLCDDGTVRAPMAAAMMNANAAQRFRAFSAGVTPGEEILSATFDALRIAGIPCDDLRAAGVAEFQRPDSPKLDFVFNLTEPYEQCGAGAFPGTPVLVPWPIPRPNLESGSHAERGARLTNSLRMIRRRVELFAELPLDRLDALAMRLHAETVHRQAETTPAAPPE